MWTEGKINSGKVGSPEFLLVDSCLLYLAPQQKKPNKSEVNSPEVEFDRKYAKMTAIAHLSLAASRSLYQEPGHGCTITAQKKE